MLHKLIYTYVLIWTSSYGTYAVCKSNNDSPDFTTDIINGIIGGFSTLYVSPKLIYEKYRTNITMEELVNKCPYIEIKW